MAKTLLDGTNDVLSRAGIVALDSPLPDLSDAGKQTFIDLTVQVWNEVVDDVCNLMGVPHVGETGSSTITLVTDTREYTLPTDLVQIRWPLVDQTNGHYIFPYPGPNQMGLGREGSGDYEQMRIDQHIPDDWMGLPYSAAINPTTGALRMDRTPTSAENGNAYNLLYDKDLVMSAATDAFPFSDSVYRALVPVATELFERRKRNDFDMQEARHSMARAVAFANKSNRRPYW